jgi:hypothetical protein
MELKIFMAIATGILMFATVADRMSAIKIKQLV